MLRSILPQPSYDHLFNVDDPDGGDGGGGGGEEQKPKGTEGLSKAEVAEIVKGRVEETRKKTAADIAEQLGVSVEDAKAIIAAHNAKAESEKSEAQKAREAADKEKAESETAKSEAAKERHATKVERHLLRALPKDLSDEETDKRAAKLARLIDVEVGADDAAIKTAVDGLKKDWPELFPAGDESGKPKGGAPSSDPKGSPPKGKPNEDAFARGQQRAKERAGTPAYGFLEKATQ